MNRQQLPRIRLKVATNAGINILCTALRTWKVVQWLPYIEEAYRQVKEDQEDDEDSKKRFIKAIRIKKGNFYIANSQLIGDIFEDNDEVQCQITFPQIAEKKKKKKEKINQKMQEKGVKQKQLPQEKIQDVLKVKQEKQEKHDIIDLKNLKSKLKAQIKLPEKQQAKQTKPKKSSKKQSKSQIKQAPAHKQHQKLLSNPKDGQSKEKLMQNIDFSKLKSLINHVESSKTRIKKVKIESESQEQLNQSNSQ